MAVTIDKLIKVMSKTNKLELLSGNGGKKRLVQWLSSIDNMAVIPYVRERELVIITGFVNNSEKDILNICKQLCEERNSCGIMINLGPYIKVIPKKIEDYCNEKDFPLIIFPWEVRIVDVINESTQIIVKNDTIEESNYTIFKNIMFHNDVKKSSYDLLERRGLGDEHYFDIILLKLMDNKIDIGELIHDTERILVWNNQKNVLVKHNDHIMIFLVDKEQSEVDAFGKILYESLNVKYKEKSVALVIGPHKKKLEDISEYYHKLLLAAKMSISLDEQIVIYEKLGTYKLLIDLADQKDDYLESYYYNIMTKLIEYDRDNNVEFVDFIWKYLEQEGNIQELANLLFVHRNTITYTIKKIHSICGFDLYNWNDRFVFHLCKYIKILYNL